MASKMRRAHLRAMHTKACGMGETSFDGATKKHGCKCQPRYRVQFRDDANKWVRETVGRDRKDAETRLREVQAELGKGTWERPAEDMTFSDWADEWFAGLAPEGGHAPRLPHHAQLCQGCVRQQAATRDPALGPQTLPRFVQAV